MSQEKENVSPEVHMTKKWVLSQLLAATAQSLIIMDVGLALSFPTVVIPALLGAKEGLSFTQEQASWFGSISLFLQPLGSVVSGSPLDILGRKKSLLIINIPHIVAWLILYFAEDVATLFVGNVIIGLGIGFMEAPIMAYVGEISHPKLRGILVGYSQVFAGLGFCLSYLLGSAFSWRTAALISLMVPIVAFICITMVPETPVWLISKGRMDDAMKSLCWLRGWCKPEDVQHEFDEIVVYQKNSVKCKKCEESSNDLACNHKSTKLTEKFRDLWETMTRKELTRPLLLVMFLHTTAHLTGIVAIRPNAVKIYASFGLPVDPYIALNISSAVGLACMILFVMVLKFFGKRRMVLMSLSVSSICTLLLGIYAFNVLPSGFSSYVAEVDVQTSSSSWFPTVLFVVYSAFPYLGVLTVPWMIISEVFPLRGRGTACGLAAAFSYVMASVVTKAHLNMENSMGVHGTFWFYSAFSAFATVCLYLVMPETEGKSFDEIEKVFSGDKIKTVFDPTFPARLEMPKTADIEMTEAEAKLLVQKSQM